MNRSTFLLIAFSWFMILTGCATHTLIPAAIPSIAPLEKATPTSPVSTANSPTPGELSYSARVATARQKWESKQIRDYHITMQFYENYARGITTQREVTVRNGQVSTWSCPINKVCANCGDHWCPAFAYQKMFSVDDLFLSAEGAATRPECIRLMQFDDSFGFPKGISIHCPANFDDEHSVSVIEFTVFEE